MINIKLYVWNTVWNEHLKKYEKLSQIKTIIGEKNVLEWWKKEIDERASFREEDESFVYFDLWRDHEIHGSSPPLVNLSFKGTVVAKNVCSSYAFSVQRGTTISFLIRVGYHGAKMESYIVEIIVE
jgi:hypothetical protein